MFRIFLLLALVCPYKTLLANPVKSPNVATYISQLAKTCTNNYFLTNDFENVSIECNIPVPPYDKEQLLCLAFYSMNDQLCQAIAKNHSNSISEETFKKFLSSKMTLEEVCNYPISFQNISAFPEFKSSIERVFNDKSCDLLCDANPKEVLNPKPNSYCKFIRWASIVLNSTKKPTVINSSLSISTTPNTTAGSASNIDDLKKPIPLFNTNTDLIPKSVADIKLSHNSLSHTDQIQSKHNTEISLESSVNDKIKNTSKGSAKDQETLQAQDVTGTDSPGITTTLKPRFTSDDTPGFNEETYGGIASMERNPDIVTPGGASFVRTVSRTNVDAGDYEEADDNFFPLFLSAIVMVAVLYILYHNKTKITKVVLGLLVEGRQGRRRNSRGHSYKRLDTLEQAMSTGTSSAPPILSQTPATSTMKSDTDAMK